MKEAMFYEKLEGSQVRCNLCRFHCMIGDGKRGHCRVRKNREGVLYSMVYGRVVAENIDPIEKKPLFHLLPGSRSYSVATVGCNFRCRHCQNYTIAQPDEAAIERYGNIVTPQAVVESALAAGCSSIAYTYTEPTIFFEFAYDTAVLAKAAGLKNVFVTNGYITNEALGVIAPYLDAANIDLKGFSDKFYRETVGASLSGVLDCIREYRRLGIWIEITTLVIPHHNDSEEELSGIANFIARELGPEVPWHVSQFYPTYLLTDEPRTPLATLRKAREIGLAAGLRYVYEGNVPGAGGEDSVCPSCGEVVIKRYGYHVQQNLLGRGRCPGCGGQVDGVWE